MKKVFTALFLATITATGSIATEPSFISCLKNVQVQADVGYESETVYRGSKIAQNSATPHIDLSYTICNITPYVGVQSVVPIANTRLSNASQVKPYVGVAWAITDMFTLDFGFMYYWYTDTSRKDTLPFINRYMNRQREFYIGMEADVLLNPALYVYYNADLAQWVVEPSVAHSFPLDQVGLCHFTIDVHAYIGWLCARKFNGNQRASDIRRHENRYFYAGTDLELAYHFASWGSIGAGPRVAFNNDGYINPPTVASFTANALGNHKTMVWWGASVTVVF